jgi:hypothetical protein
VLAYGATAPQLSFFFCGGVHAGLCCGACVRAYPDRDRVRRATSNGVACAGLGSGDADTFGYAHLPAPMTRPSWLP